MRGIYIPSTYNISQGEVDLHSPCEAANLLAIEIDDLERLPIACDRGAVYLSRAAQRDRVAFNKTATFVLKELMPIGIGVYGDALFVQDETSFEKQVDS
jgi:hypothetical protein